MRTSKKLRIAELAPLWKIIPPQKYGGSELVVSNITERLVEEGHDVTLFACGGSNTSAKLVDVIEKPMYDLLGGFSWDAIQPYEFLAFADLFDRIDDFDIIHNHLGFHPLVFSKIINIPIVTTLHSSVKPDFPYLAERFKNNPFVSISNAQRKLVPDLHYVETIYHGIVTKKFEPDYSPNKDYFLFIGTLSPNKGIDIAVKACHKLHEKLIIAGELRDSDAEFLKKEVFPYVDGDDIRFIGEVGHDDKVKLYKDAKALLFPIRWNEAFGLVMAESLASGTPVIAFENGSIPEVITDNKTGFVVNSEEDFVNKMGEVNQISREICRKEAEERFDVSIMTQRYVDLFTRLIEKNTI